MTKRLMQVFVAAGAMAMLAGGVEAKTTKVENSPGPEHSAAAERLAQAIFIDPAAKTASDACFATPTARRGAQEPTTTLRLSSTVDRLASRPASSSVSEAQARADGASRFASAAAPAASAHASQVDWGAVDAAYRGGPISSYGADGQYGLGVKVAVW